MERIKRNKFTIIIAAIAVFLFFIPFFWFKPGEMDLGGDSSRLYFYDPLAYLHNYALYSVSPSSFGAENIGYYMIPFVIFIWFLKLIFSSPTILIAFFHGISLSIAFLTIYGIVIDLLNRKNKSSVVLQVSAIMAGLMYVFSQPPIGGWEKVLVTHNQFFLNPLIFFFFLRYFKTSKLIYLFITLLVTVIFMPNFSFAAAPAFFAFYPVSLLFLLFYSVIILKKKIIWKHIIFTGIMFIGLQSIHVIPQLISAFSPGTSFNTTIFSDAGKFDRGLSYFLAIAPNIKVSLNLMNLPQMTEVNLGFYPAIFFPLIITLGFLFNRSKTLLLTGGFFIIVLFFASANITTIGLETYKKLFYLPGFSMFRNFYGQWGYALLFFYTILFGLSFFTLLIRAKNKYQYFICSILLMTLIIPAIPFINGSLVNKNIWQSNNIKLLMTMDSQYEEAIKFMKTLPADVKVLVLPLSDPGYQIVFGLNNGAYQGPSTISYLAGKKDFAGLTEFGIFQDTLKEYVLTKNYKGLHNLFLTLNIKYIFYNSDSNVYEKGFPRFPYQEARKFLPNTQQEYDQFLSNAGFKKIKQIKHIAIYELDNKKEQYEVSIPARIIPVEKDNFNFVNYFNEYDLKDTNSIFLSKDYVGKKNSIIETTLMDPINLRINDYPIEVVFPYTKWSLSSPLYPFITYKENEQIKKAPSDAERANIHLSLAAKRISELESWGNQLSYEEWKEQLMRYSNSIHESIKYVKTNEQEKIIYGNKLDQTLFIHNNRINDIISKQQSGVRKRLFVYKENIFSQLESDLRKAYQNEGGFLYTIQNTTNASGVYDIVAAYDKNHEEIFKNSFIVIGEDTYPVREINTIKGVISYGQIKLNQKDRLIILKNENEIIDTSQDWEKVKGLSQREEKFQTVNDISLKNDNSNLIKRIDKWSQQNKYEISFEYKTYGKSVEVSVFTRGVKGKLDKKDPPYTALFREVKNAPEWISFTAIVESELTKDGLVAVRGLDNEGTKISIKNFKVLKLAEAPEVRLKVPGDIVEKVSVPQHRIEKINSTKYIITIKGSKKPYYLALTNQFNKNWQLYKSEKRNDNFPYTLFETFDQKPISADHFVVNGFANGWYIEPKDIHNEKDYTLILEYKTQKIFYIGLIISSITFFCILFLLIKLLKNRN